MRRTALVFLTAALLLACLVCVVSAEEQSGTCGAGLTWSFNSVTGVLRITGSGAMEDYSSAEEHHAPWYCFRASIMTVIVRNGVTSIGSSAFEDCVNLTSAAFPGSVTYLGDDAFRNCSSLKEMILPENVTIIGRYAFRGCAVLDNIQMPNAVVKIRDGAFFDCKSLEYISIPNTVESIGEEVFYNCTAMKSIAIPEHTKSIGPYALGYYSGQMGEDVQESPVTPPTFTLQRMEDFVICGIQGSAAQIYAAENGFQFFERSDNQADFQDVPSDAYYTLPVWWAFTTGITKGTSAVAFSPNAGCTRAQVVTFLWRAAGTPEPTATNNPFKDVKDGAYYYKAVLWAVENKVTAGTAADKFSPDVTCTRAQIVTFLWRYEGNPEPTTTDNPFKDVKPGAYYEKAVLWASETGVTAGTSATTFSPEATCTRAQVVTFLYRDDVKK